LRGWLNLAPRESAIKKGRTGGDRAPHGSAERDPGAREGADRADGAARPGV